MRDERLASRIGGWAVALGVGVAVASNPGIAWAQPDTGGTGAGDNTSSVGHRGTPSKEKPARTSKADRAADKPSRKSADKPSRTSKIGGTDEDPSASTTDTDTEADAATDTETDATPAVEESRDTTARTPHRHVESVEPQEPAGTAATAAPEERSTERHDSAATPVTKQVRTPVTEKPRTPRRAGSVTELRHADAVDLDGRSVAPTADAGRFRAPALAPHAPADSARTVGTLNPTAESSDLTTGHTDPAAETPPPGTLRKLATDLIGAALHPFGAPGPAQPAQAPMLWGLLEWARREFLRDNKTSLTITQDTEQLDEGVVGGVPATWADVTPFSDTFSEDPTVNMAGMESQSATTTEQSAVTAAAPTTVLTLAGAFSSSGNVPPQLQGEITAGNTVVPVLYQNSDLVGWIFGGGTRPEYIADGVQKLNTAINATPGPKIVLGTSLGAEVAQYWLAQYGRTSTIPADELRFVLIGNSIRKYGGRNRSQPANLAVANAVQVPDIRYPVLDIARQWDMYADYPMITSSEWYSDAVYNARAGDRWPFTLHADYRNVAPDPDAPGNTKLVEGNWTYVWSRTNDLPLFYSAWNRFVYGVSGMTAAQLDELWRPRIESAQIRPVPIP